jgi:allantoicase
MYPDGGIARFRLFGSVVPVFPAGSVTVDLAHVANGGLAVAYSDQHFGKASNLLLPGRGVDMGDGWETRRSRVPGHSEWVIVKLGAPGLIERAIIDTAHFKGNFPKMAKLEATASDEVCS